VAGTPLVARVIRWLAGHGVRDAVLNLHHRPETISRQIGDGSDLGVRVRYSWENPILGSAGGPRHALPLLDGERVVIVNGDTLTDLNLKSMIAAHEHSGAWVTMALIPNPKPEQYGGVILDEDRVAGFTPRQPGARNYHFIGVQVVETHVFASLPDNQPAESVRALYPALMKERPGAIRGFVSEASFDDIGTPGDYYQTSLAIAAREGAEASLRGARTRVATSASAPRTILWDDVILEEDAELVECIVTDGVRVPAGTQLIRSIVLPASAELFGAAAERRDNLLIAAF
jgi:NDP-sugar pyrophosphorylase family protein